MAKRGSLKKDINPAYKSCTTARNSNAEPSFRLTRKGLIFLLDVTPWCKSHHRISALLRTVSLKTTDGYMVLVKSRSTVTKTVHESSSGLTAVSMPVSYPTMRRVFPSNGISTVCANPFTLLWFSVCYYGGTPEILDISDTRSHKG